METLTSYGQFYFSVYFITLFRIGVVNFFYILEGYIYVLNLSAVDLILIIAAFGLYLYSLLCIELIYWMSRNVANISNLINIAL